MSIRQKDRQHLLLPLPRELPLQGLYMTNSLLSTSYLYRCPCLGPSNPSQPSFLQSDCRHYFITPISFLNTSPCPQETIHLLKGKDIIVLTVTFPSPQNNDRHTALVYALVYTVGAQ